jgi:hypothetical protein
VWIVQEVCLPHELVFAYGSKIWTFEEIEQWQILKQRNAQQSGTVRMNDHVQAMTKLINTRKTRYSSSMRLEHLIELFMKNCCTETRDRIYGIAGLAHDIRLVGVVESSPDPVGKYIDSLALKEEPLPELKRGKGILRVDYNRSYYDIWADVVKFAYFGAKDFGVKECHAQKALPSPLHEELSRHEKDGAKSVERKITVVRTAEIIQSALDQKVKDDVVRMSLPLV